jgi:hypothetical protein
VIQRDYLERLIEECAEALARILRLRRAGEVDPAFGAVSDATERLLGPLRPVLERLEPGNAVAVAGPFEHGRVRMYAALLGEEGLIHRARGDSARAYLCCRRALELYAAVSLAGARLDGADRGRIAVLMGTVKLDALDPRYGDELRRLEGRTRPPG